MEHRPEHFLKVNDPQNYRPIIDYHLQRSALRTGLVNINEPFLMEKLRKRAMVSEDEELAVRDAVYRAIYDVVKTSGSTVAAIDYFFFQNRHTCPEMSVPDCASCPVRSICSQQTELFQPVFRTEAY